MRLGTRAAEKEAVGHVAYGLFDDANALAHFFHANECAGKAVAFCLRGARQIQSGRICRRVRLCGRRVHGPLARRQGPVMAYF